ncbi:MAG: recombination regulator RecX [Actinomycetota bacterium]|nr:recombination regulator RecX [Actinomycetota bacterium]
MASEPNLFLVDDTFADELKEAMERAGRLLSVRARTVDEIRDRLRQAGFDGAVVEQTTTRLSELGLLNDLEFAHEWVRQRALSKNLGPRALKAELSAKGVPREVAEDALARACLDEEALAREAASRWVRKVAARPLPEQAFKLQQMLLRKGFSLEAAEAGTKAVLPPEGWD